MDIETLRAYCLSKPHVSEDLPFDEDTLVFKVGGKIFVLTGLSGPFSINLKCDPEYALELRELYPAIRPGYHMNKRHWNTLDMDGSLAPELVRQLIDHSYALVYASLTKKVRTQLESGTDF